MYPKDVETHTHESGVLRVLDTRAHVLPRGIGVYLWAVTQKSADDVGLARPVWAGLRT